MARADGIEPDKTMYSCLFNAAVALPVSDKAVMYFDELAKFGTPSVVSCNILLKGFARQGEWTRAEALLTQMLGANMPLPNLISLNTIMECAVRKMKFLTSCNNGLRPSASINSSGDGVKSSDGAGTVHEMAQKLWKILDHLTELGLEPDGYTWSTLAEGIHIGGCSGDEIDRVLVMVRQIIQRKSLDPGAGVGTLNSLIKAFGHAGCLGRCREIWEEMRVAGVKPTAVTFGCFIDANIGNGELEAAVRIFDSMSEQHVRPNTVIYTSLIQAFGASGEPSRACEFYRRMRSEGVVGNKVTFRLILDIICRQMSDPEMLCGILKDMKVADAHVDSMNCSVLLRGSCTAGLLENAVMLFREVRMNNLGTFDDFALNDLLLACATESRIADTEEILSEIFRQRAGPPSSAAVYACMAMFRKAKMPDKAAELKDRMAWDFHWTPTRVARTHVSWAG